MGKVAKESVTNPASRVSRKDDTVLSVRVEDERMSRENEDEIREEEVRARVNGEHSQTKERWKLQLTIRHNRNEEIVT